MDNGYIERIKKCKSEQKINNEMLSAMTGIPFGTLSKILAGISDSPRLSNMMAICDALGVSLQYIMTGEPENHCNYLLEEDEIALMERYRSLAGYGGCRNRWQYSVLRQTKSAQRSRFRHLRNPPGKKAQKCFPRLVPPSADGSCAFMICRFPPVPETCFRKPLRCRFRFLMTREPRRLILHCVSAVTAWSPVITTATFCWWCRARMWRRVSWEFTCWTAMCFSKSSAATA